eukprot:9471551-Pyramimonas_sp.AAC.2
MVPHAHLYILQLDESGDPRRESPICGLRGQVLQRSVVLLRVRGGKAALQESGLRPRVGDELDQGLGAG